MSEKDMVITYEKLFEFLRLEKNREELQKLDSDFFDLVLKYLCTKQESFESKQSQQLLFERDEKEKARLEIENVKKILKDLYDRREKKILNMALNKSRSGISLVNMGAMLPSEQGLFSKINLTLSQFREDTLFKIVSGKNICKEFKPQTDQDNQKETETTQSEDSDGAVHGHFKQSETQEAQSEETKELKTTPFLNESTANLKKVRFLASIEEVIGPDLQIYGPYDSGAVKELPSELAAVLVKNQQAEEV